MQGRLTASEKDKRTLKGLLLPYGQVGNTNLGQVKCAPGAIDVPATMSRLVASLAHPARQTGAGECATFTRVWEEADGLHAEWRVAQNPAGDRLLAEYASGARTGVSVELDPVAIDASGNIVTGRLDACAFPERPAFDAARLCASAPEVALDEDRDVDRLLADYDTESTSTSVDEYDDPETGEHVKVTTTRTTRETSTTEVDGQAVDEDEDEDEGDDVSGTDERLEAGRRSAGQPRSTNGRTATAPSGTRKSSKSEEPSYGEVLRLMAAYSQGDRSRTLMAALSDITETGTAITRPPAWLGEMWTGQPYVRRFTPLVSSAPLTNLRVKGYRWVKKPYMAPYDGNKANIPSDTVSFEPYEDSAKRLAGGHDIDRAHVDFGDTAFFDAYYRAMAESYARESDKACLAKTLTEAPEITLGAVPSDVDAGTAAVVDLYLALIERGAMTSVTVAPDVYRLMLLTPQERRLAFLSQSLGLEEGSVSSFRVVPNPSVDTGRLLGVIKSAVTFRELSGTPIRADALDIARGGVDHACFGYVHTEVNEDGVATADLTAATGAAPLVTP